MKRKIKTKKAKVLKTKAKTEKPDKAKELFKYKKATKAVKTKITGNHYYRETLATDEHGDPVVTQNTTMFGDNIIKTVIHDMKSNITICKNYE